MRYILIKWFRRRLYYLFKPLSVVYDNADPPEARVRMTEGDQAVYYNSGGQVKGDNAVYYNTVEWRHDQASRDWQQAHESGVNKIMFIHNLVFGYLFTVQSWHIENAKIALLQTV